MVLGRRGGRRALGTDSETEMTEVSESSNFPFSGIPGPQKSPSATIFGFQEQICIYPGTTTAAALDLDLIQLERYDGGKG